MPDDPRHGPRHGQRHEPRHQSRRAAAGRDQDAPWFRDAAVLVDQLRRCHRRLKPVPVVDGYSDLVPLQGGGQGMVFLATRISDKGGGRVALKVFHDHSFDSTLARRRFEREIALVSRLVHPNVVRLHHYGTTRDGRAFLSMEFVHGLPLGEWVEGRDVDEIVELILQLCGALDHAHRRGVIHRDLKPGNVRVDPAGNARLLDFGLAKPIAVDGGEPGPEPADALSLTGEFVGSLKWAAPEQVAGHPDEVDTRTDIHALGLLLHHCLTGGFPYPVDGSVAQVVESIRHASPKRLGRAVQGAHEDLDTILLRCLAKDPDRRYATVADLARDLEHFLDGEPIEARRDGWRYQLSTLLRGHPVASAAVGLVAVGLLVFSVVISGFYKRATDAEATAVTALADKRHEADRIEQVNEFLLSSFLGTLPGSADPEETLLADVLENAAGRIETVPSLADEPLVRADLHVAFAFWFNSFPGRAAEAEAHADEALALYAKSAAANAAANAGANAGAGTATQAATHGAAPSGTTPRALPDSAQAAWASEIRGSIRLQDGRFEAARADLLMALQTYRAVQSDEVNLARVIGHVASCAFALDEYDGVEDLLLECRAIVVGRRGEDDPQVANLDAALAHLRERLAGP